MTGLGEYPRREFLPTGMPISSNLPRCSVRDVESLHNLQRNPFQEKAGQKWNRAGNADRMRSTRHRLSERRPNPLYYPICGATSVPTFLYGVW